MHTCTTYIPKYPQTLDINECICIVFIILKFILFSFLYKSIVIVCWLIRYYSTEKNKVVNIFNAKTIILCAEHVYSDSNRVCTAHTLVERLFSLGLTVSG